MQFLINRPNSPSSPHHREKKLLTTLNNPTFDSHTRLSVQRNSYSLVFIPLSIPTKSYLRDRFSIEPILCLRMLYRRPALQHSLSPLRSFSDPRRSVPESSCAWGIRRSEPTLKPGNDQRSNEFLGGIFTSFGLFPGAKSYRPSRPVSFGNYEQRIFCRAARILQAAIEFHEHCVVSETPVPLRTSTTKSEQLTAKGPKAI